MVQFLMCVGLATLTSIGRRPRGIISLGSQNRLHDLTKTPRPGHLQAGGLASWSLDGIAI